MSNHKRKLWAGLFAAILLSSPRAWAETPSAPPPQDIPAEKALTLDDCYGLSLKRSEEIAIRGQRIEEVNGEYIQAVSELVPKSSFLLKEFHQESSSASSGSSDAVSSSFNLTSQPERKFTLQQPLFRGFKILAAINGAGAYKNQRIFEEKRGRELLFLDVSDAFYGLLQPRDEVQTLHNILDLIEKRILELDDRVRLGRSRPSEIATAKAQLKTIQAQMERLRRSEVYFMNLLRYLTGKDSIPDLADTMKISDELDDLDVYLKKADQRSDVQAAQFAVAVAKQAVVFARGNIFPTLTYNANLYAKRVGFQSGIDWDNDLTFDVPLLSGVEVTGAVKKAKARLQVAELELSRTLRLAQKEVKTAYEEYKVSLSEIAAFREAVAAAQDNYNIQSQEYRLNLVNNLDVLAALQDLENTRRDMVVAIYQAKRDRNALKVATGDVP